MTIFPQYVFELGQPICIEKLKAFFYIRMGESCKLVSSSIYWKRVLFYVDA